MFWFVQWRSSLDSKVATVLAVTTDDGRLFQRSTDLNTNEFFLMLRRALLLYSFKLCPLVVVSPATCMKLDTSNSVESEASHKLYTFCIITK
jgi:hypothetical protein